MKKIAALACVVVMIVGLTIGLRLRSSKDEVPPSSAPPSAAVPARQTKQIQSLAPIATPVPVAPRPLVEEAKQSVQPTPRFSARQAPSDPELARLELRKINGPAVDGRFRDMYLQLGMSPEEIARFRDLRLDMSERSSSLFRKAAKQDRSKDRESLQTVADVVNDHASSDFESALIEAFGSEKARLMIEFAKKPYRRPERISDPK